MKTETLKATIPLVLSLVLIANVSAAYALEITPGESLTITEGNHVLDAAELQAVTGLTVGAGASAAIDFGNSSQLSLTGNIVNNGSLYAFSSSAATSTAFLSAANISNNSGAVLSSSLPSTMSGLAAVSNLNLSLTALQNIFNVGTISSAGALSMVAGGTITNQGVINAVNNIDIAAALGNITNSGIIASVAGNINIGAMAAQNIMLTNLSGSIQALLGDINIQTTGSALDKLNLTVLGGDFLSKELNLKTLEGIAILEADDVSGVLNISAGEAHVTTSTPTLSLGEMIITGDPTFYNTAGDISLTTNLSFTGVAFTLMNVAIVASGDITANGCTLITTNGLYSAGPPVYPGVSAGNVLIVAGASFTASPGPGPVTPTTSPTGMPQSALTLTGASSTGGQINLTGVTIDTTASYFNGTPSPAGANGGTVTLVAYSGSNANSGTITTGAIQTGEQPYQPGASTLNHNAAQNGQVVIIAEANSGTAVNAGAINSSGNQVNPYNYSGSVYIGSNTPVFLATPDASGTITTTVGTTALGNSTLLVSSTTGLATGSLITLNPYGQNAETVTVTGTGTGTFGAFVTLQNPLQFNHSPAENLYVSTSSITIPAGTGPAGQSIIANNSIIAPGAVQSGGISTATINAGANVYVQTAGAITASGNISLNQNPQLLQNPSNQSTPAAYNSPPNITLTGSAISVAAGATVSSQIANCVTCLDSMNLNTSSLSNAGTISSNNLLVSNSSGPMTVNNGGTISGVNNSAMLYFQSADNLTLSGSGSMTVPDFSVIELAAADGKTLLFSSNHTFTPGTNSLLIFNAQNSNGNVSIATNTTLSIGSGTSVAPVVSINTPKLTFADGATIAAAGASNIVVTSGALAQNPLPLVVQLTGTTAGITTEAGGNVIFRPVDGQNLSFTSPNTGTSFDIGSGTLYLFTGTAIGGTSPGGVTVNVNVPAGYTKVANPNGGIVGTAFQPYVGGLIPSTNTYPLASAYSYAQTLVLLAPIVGTGMFQTLMTYTQGVFPIQGGDLSSPSGYTIAGAAQYVIQAARQVGLRVSAGSFSQNPDKSVNVVGTQVDTNFALQQAQRYGNVIDIVVGNECIVGNPATASASQLAQAMQYAQNTRGSYGFTASTLPVTTRQTYGVLSGVNQTATQSYMVELMNGCTACTSLGSVTSFLGTESHVYANVYPYYDSPYNTTVSPSMGQSAFASGAGAQIQADMNGTISAFQSANITPKLRIAETGWASQANPNNAPQANQTLAGWYYGAMQSWSSTNASANALGYQIPIVGYFESYDEPNKIDTVDPGMGGEPFFGIWTATGTTTVINNVGQFFAFTNIAEKTYPGTSGGQLPFVQLFQPPGAELTASAPQALPTLAARSTSFVVPTTVTSMNATELSRTSSTVVPTDINPEREPTSNFQQQSLTNLAPLNALLTQGAFPNLDPQESFVTLNSGSGLYAPSHDISVQAGFATVQISAGSVAMIIMTESGPAIYNLHDSATGEVKVTVNGDGVELPVGRQLLLTQNAAAEYDEINPSAIGYRNLSKGSLGGKKSFTSEFSVSSALGTVGMLKILLGSDKKNERDVARRIMKTAAAFAVINKGKPFKPRG